MQCVICKHGQTQPGLVTVVLERENAPVILKQVPAEVCENCGEYYLNQTVTDLVLNCAEEAVNKGAELKIIGYVA